MDVKHAIQTNSCGDEGGLCCHGDAIVLSSPQASIGVISYILWAICCVGLEAITVYLPDIPVVQ